MQRRKNWLEFKIIMMLMLNFIEHFLSLCKDYTKDFCKRSFLFFFVCPSLQVSLPLFNTFLILLHIIPSLCHPRRHAPLSHHPTLTHCRAAQRSSPQQGSLHFHNARSTKNPPQSYQIRMNCDYQSILSECALYLNGEAQMMCSMRRYISARQGLRPESGVG
jgi:hypothetical protein